MQFLQAEGVKEFVSIVAFTPDGGRLIAGTGDGCVRVWDLTTGKIAYTIDRRPAADDRAIVVSPDGRNLITGDNVGIRVWDAATGNPVRTIAVDRGSPATVTITPDGREQVAADDPYSPGLRRWDAASGEALPTWPLPSPIAFTKMLFSPDGRWLGAHAGAGVTVWDVATREEVLAALDAPTLGTAALAWSPDSKWLASGCANILIVWDVVDRRVVGRLKLPRKHFQFAAFSPDGASLVTVSNEATARLWDTAGWNLRAEFAWEIGSLKSVAIAQDGLRAAAGGEKGRAVVWDL